MGKYFGTDGFRGRANESLTAEQAFRVGRYLGYLFSQKREERAKIVIGKDTRRSSYMLEYALAAGITASGADAYLLHVTTTPSVAFVARTEGFACGVMISASHNGYEDNGIKIVNGNGEKAEDVLLGRIEDYLDGKEEIPLATGGEIGRTIDYVAGRNRYLAYLLSLPRRSFRGLRVGLDCANGSAWAISKAVFDALGAKVTLTGADPDGMNINKNCGSTSLGTLQTLVKENGLDVGFAFDGDADRCLCVDEKGEAVDGDGILYFCAKYMKERGELNGNAVAVTETSNTGLLRSLDREGVSCYRTKVGDRFVYEEMTKRDLSLGGEQSGHIIFRKYATTGDGILTAVKAAEIWAESKCPFSCLTEGLTLFPQASLNIPVREKRLILQNGEVLAAKARAQTLLGDGRLVLRVSGTESVVRVLAEGEREEDCRIAVKLVERAVYSAERGICAES